MDALKHIFSQKDVQKNLLYTGIILVILVGVGAAHNALMTESDDTTTLGYCNVTLVCNGVDAGVCIGLERQEIQCIDPQDAIEKGVDYEMRAEVECALQAYKICDARDMERGTEWAQYATYDDKTCEQLNTERGVELIDCFDTYRPLKWPEN